MGSLSRRARLYIAAMVAAGAGVMAWQLPAVGADHQGWLIAVALLASVAQVLKVEGVTVRSNYNASLVAYAFALLALGLPAALVVMSAACIVDWAWHRYRWYIQTFNIAAMAVSLVLGDFARSIMVSLLGGSSGAVRILPAVAAALVFVASNHLAVGGVILLARRETLRESGLFGRLPLVIDGALFSLGALTGALWSTTPYVVVLAIVPLYPIYLALRVPSLERQVVVDPKTGLFNSLHFNKELARELERAHRFERPLTVVLGDLDLLRNINNTFGHLAGDVVLITVAAILKESVREYDVVARFGGEEFAILMPETEPDDARLHIEEIRARIAAEGFEVSTSVDPIRATMSFGIAGRSSVGQTATELMHQADLAVYRAKLEGRNRVCVSDGPDDPFVPFLGAPEDIHSPAFPAGNGAGPSVKTVGSVGDREPWAATAMRPTGSESTVASADPSSGTPAGERAAPLVEPSDPSSDRPPLSRRAVALRLAATVGIALIGFVAALRLVPDNTLQMSFADVGEGLLVFGLIAVAVELLSIDIYARDTSVSTSGAVLVAGVVLFGPVAALVLSLLAAGAAMVKHHSPANRFAFNMSVHGLAGLASAAVAATIAAPLDSPGDWRWAAACIAAAALYFVMTTFSVAWAISWAGKERARAIWNDRFRWLAPYYAALGLAAFGLIFGFMAAGILGVLVVVTPLLLLRYGQKQYVSKTKTMVADLRDANAGLRARAEQVSQLSQELLAVVAHAVDARDPYVAGHSRHVARYAQSIAEEMGLSGERLELVRKAALLHDIGKLGIPESILFKPARLSDAEYTVVKRHSELGARILEQSGSLRTVVPIVLHHHEHHDGSGYPGGLRSNEIPLEARIVAVADAVEAMASDRPYRAGMCAADIVAEVQRCAGTQFDPTAAAAFCRLVDTQGPGVIVNLGLEGATPGAAALHRSDARVL